MDYDNVMKNQATINIGIIGHVAHGKSTLVNSISGVKTVRFKSELEKNITIKLGYANTKIYKCDSKDCPRPDCYSSFNSSIKKDIIKCKRKNCNGTLKLVKHVSFVDCPGHDVLMSTMINGTAIMDAAILMISANESCPQPQTKEHLFALEKTNIPKILVLQNKIDLLSRERCLEHKDKIVDFLNNTKARGSPVLPVSGQYGLNINAVLDLIVNYIPKVDKNLNVLPKMVIIRSFDVNKPGYKIEMLRGGVIGGSLLCGKVKIGDTIEIRPGNVIKNKNRFICYPYITKVVSLKTEENDLEVAYPGGLIGIGTDLDPSYCIADSLVGQVMGVQGGALGVYQQIIIEYELFQDVVVDKFDDKKSNFLNVGEYFLLNIGSCSLIGILKKKENNVADFELRKPVCTEIQEKITISKKLRGNWRLIGYGKIIDGDLAEIRYDEDAAWPKFKDLEENLVNV